MGSLEMILTVSFNARRDTQNFLVWLPLSINQNIRYIFRVSVTHPPCSWCHVCQKLGQRTSASPLTLVIRETLLLSWLSQGLRKM